MEGNGISMPKLRNNHFASSFLVNLDFLLPHTAQFDNIVDLLLLYPEIFGFVSSVFFLHFKH